MGPRTIAVVLLAMVAAPGAASMVKASSNAAIQKVIAMMNDMSAKAKEAKMQEEIAFAKFETWCGMEQKKLEASIAKQGETIELLKSEIDKLGSDAKTLGDEVAELQEKVADSEADKKAQEEERKKDREAYMAELKDYRESISALDRAITALSEKMKDQPQASAASLLQLSTSEGIVLPQKAQAMVESMMQMMGKEWLDSEAPEAGAYEGQSGGIIDMMAKIKKEFVAKKGQCEKEEMNSQNAYAMVVVDLMDTIENGKKDIEEKSALKESKLERQSTAKGELQSTIASKMEDEKTLHSVSTECTEKTYSFHEKQKLRAGEIEALAQAVGILSSDDVSGGAAHLELAQGASLLQVRSEPENALKVQRRVRDFIRAEGRRLKSNKLYVLAQSVDSSANPFDKVKKLIDDMITKLLEEANADAEKEGFCDKEMGMNKITRDKLNEEIDQMSAAIEDSKATIMALTQEIADLEKEVSDLQSSMEEATDLRAAEKAKNKDTIADAKAAEVAVAKAQKVLKDFYAKAAQATAFLQTNSETQKAPVGTVFLSQRAQGIKMGSDEWKALANPNFEADSGHKAGMATFGDSNTGQQDAAGGVMAMLDIILSDFAGVQTDTEAAETSAQMGYEDFMTEAQKNIKMKRKKVELDTADKTDVESKLREDVADLKNTQDELLAADRYYDKLVPQCVDKGPSYEEQQAAREKEIASLKEALEIISSSV